MKKYLSTQYNWYVANMHKIVFVIGLHFLASHFVTLPYINIFAGLFAVLPYFVDWVAILFLFKPRKELILKIGLLLLIVSYIFALLNLDFVTEILGQVIFFAIGTYVILSLKEIRS